MNEMEGNTVLREGIIKKRPLSRLNLANIELLEKEALMIGPGKLIKSSDLVEEGFDVRSSSKLEVSDTRVTEFGTNFYQLFHVDVKNNYREIGDNIPARRGVNFGNDEGVIILKTEEVPSRNNLGLFLRGGKISVLLMKREVVSTEG